MVLTYPFISFVIKVMRTFQAGIAQILVILLLLVGIGAGLVLVQRQSNLIPLAQKEDEKSYIVVLKDEVENPEGVSDEISQANLLVPKQKFSKVIKGFSVNLDSAKLEKIKGDPRVKFISEDREVRADAPPNKTPKPSSQTISTGIKRIGADLNPNKGANIGVAILDTGVDLRHQDLKANIVANKSCVAGARNGQDDSGHGTAVAGVVAAINNSVGVVGVASQAKLIAVKVLNSSGTGSWSDVICGIDWVATNASTYNIKIINLSLGGGGISDNSCGNTNFDALHLAVCHARDTGVTIVTSAGNEGQDASNFVPAAYDDSVITVSALNDTDGTPGGLGAANSQGADDTFPSFSNFGSVVDLGAPGINIYTTWIGGDYNYFNETSAAAPHVSGAAALYLKTNPGSNWMQVRDGLKAVGEALNQGHTDPSGNHPEPVGKASSL